MGEKTLWILTFVEGYFDEHGNLEVSGSNPNRLFFNSRKSIICTFLGCFFAIYSFDFANFSLEFPNLYNAGHSNFGHLKSKVSLIKDLKKILLWKCNLCAPKPFILKIKYFFFCLYFRGWSISRWRHDLYSKAKRKIDFSPIYGFFKHESTFSCS